MNNQQINTSQSWPAVIKECALLLSIVFLIRTFGFGLYQVPTESAETTMLVGERFFANKFTYLFSDPQRNDYISMNDPTFVYSSCYPVRLYQEYVGWPIWPFGPTNFTKRIIGIPGDHVKGVIEDGKPVVYLNDKKLDEPYLNKYPIMAVVLGDKITWRSYDPAVSDTAQQFYRVTNPWHPDSNMNITSEYTRTKEGRLLMEPNKPTKSDEFDIVLGENQYWGMGDNRRGSADSRVFGPIDRRLIHGKIVFRIWSIDSNESWWIIDLITHPIDFWSRLRWNRFFQWIQ